MTRLIQMGLGPIGIALARHAHRSAGLELVGAVDPAHVGADLGALIGTGHSGLAVVASVAELPAAARVQLVLHATGSSLPQVAQQVRPLLARGLHVVSTCEELSWPFRRHPDLAADLDDWARRHGAVLLGTGVNPGFAMDKLVATLAAACLEVRAVHVVRVLDAARRRGPFQRKVGAGLTRDAFERRRAAGALGHVGLSESAHLLADLIGVTEERELEQRIAPVIATRAMATDDVAVAVGQVAGTEQSLVLRAGGIERVRLEMRMAFGEPEPRDEIRIDGTPPLHAKVIGGIPGDTGTVAVALSAAAAAPALRAGLRTMLDVPLRPPPPAGRG